MAAWSNPDEEAPDGWPKAAKALEGVERQKIEIERTRSESAEGAFGGGLKFKPGQIS